MKSIMIIRTFKSLSIMKKTLLFFMIFQYSIVSLNACFEYEQPGLAAENLIRVTDQRRDLTFVEGANTSIGDKSEAILLETDIDSDVLIVTFGGMHHTFNTISMYEFYNILKTFKVKKIFVKDNYKCWYQHGIDETGSISKTILRLDQEIQKANCKKVIFFGDSAGGYASLLFGRVLQADIVHAFAPQTIIGPLPFILNLVNPNILNYQYLEPQYLDLQNVFLQFHNLDNKTIFHIYYSNDSGPYLDDQHAKRMEQKQVILHEFHKGGHGLIKELKKDGILLKIIQDTIPLTYHKNNNRFINQDLESNKFFLEWLMS